MRVDVGGGDDALLNAVFARRAFARDLLHLRHKSWRTAEADIPDLGVSLASALSEQAQDVVADLRVGLVRIHLHAGYVTVHTAAGSRQAAKNLMRQIGRHFPAPVPRGERVAAVTFWSSGEYGPGRAVLTLVVPRWEDVSRNYPGRIREQLTHLVRAFPPQASERLVLWHGFPGTGKTYAIRALAWEWRSWCEVHYMSDPEVLLGGPPSYLMKVAGVNEPRSRNWRLIVLEDTGELISADAKSRTGQGLSRLLNLSDGLLGQECKTLVLVTTNEQIGVLHPAIARPGRAAATIEFTSFPGAEAAQWLTDRGRAPEATPHGSGDAR